MARQTKGGSLKPVRVIDDDDLIANGGQYSLGSYVAVPVRGFTSATRNIIGAPSIAVYVVTDAQINSGEFEIHGGAVDPVIQDTDMPYTPIQGGRYVALPVYAINDWPTPVDAGGWFPTDYMAEGYWSENGFFYWVNQG